MASRSTDGLPGPFWPLDATGAAPGQRAAAQAALDALPELLYAQVVKSYRRRRIVGVKYRVVFGTMERVQQVLAACGWKINTAFVERLNLDIRQRVAAVGRRVNTLCQGEDGLRQQLAVYHATTQFLPAPCELAPAVAGSRAHQRQWLRQGVAAVYAGDGGGIAASWGRDVRATAPARQKT